MSRSFDVRIHLNDGQRYALRNKSKALNISMSEYVRRLVRACADDDLPDFIREENVHSLKYNGI